MSGLENLLKDEIFQERNVDERISLYQRLMQKGKNVVASTALVGTLLGGFIGVDVKPRSVYAGEAGTAEASVNQDMYESIAKRMEELNAKKQYDAVIELAKDYVDQPDNKNGLFYNELGRAYKNKKEYDKAKEFLEKSVKIYNEQDPDSLYNLTATYVSLNEKEKAAKYAKAVVEHFPNYKFASQLRNWLNNNGY